MIRNKLNTLILRLFVASTLSISVFATDGYFRHGYGIKYSALAGSGVAVSLSSLGAISNPAGIVFLEKDRYDFNISYFSPSREFTVTGNPSPPPEFGLATGTNTSAGS
jgi:long-chain fatty acid transport protein